MTDVHQWGKMNYSALRPCFIDHLFLTSDFRQIPRRNLFQFFPPLSTASFAAGIFMAWDIGINSCTNFLCFNELSPFPAIWSSWWFGKDSPIRSLVDSLASKIHANFDLISLDFTTGHSMLTVLACLARHSGSHWRFQFLASILVGYFKFLVLRGQWNKFLVNFWHYRVLAFLSCQSPPGPHISIWKFFFQ